jgi:hypothetical protein
VLKRMADDIDWTEQLGEAMVAQDGDVLDAVQRQRARAAAAGNLLSNEAQTVTVVDDQISIAPANPNVVYVPAYDSQSVYTQPATQTVVQQDDTKYTGTEMVLTGVLAFGAGMLVNEMFDDDDDDWGGYWRGPPPVNWGGGQVYPRPGRGGNYVGGDVNINVDRSKDTAIAKRGEAWQPGGRQQAEARQKIQTRNKALPAAGTRPATRPATGVARPASTRDAAGLESRMKKRDPSAAGGVARPTAATRPAAAPNRNAFAGSRESGTKARKDLDRGRNSKDRAATSPAGAKSGGSPAQRRSAAPTQRKQPQKADVQRGRDKAANRGGSGGKGGGGGRNR